MENSTDPRGKLVISRKAGQSFVVQTGIGDIEITVLQPGRGQAKLLICSDKNFKILRSELLERNEDLYRAIYEVGK